ncbi:MAG TPA: hypothetical protein VK395_07955 [Gemmataceae bacterium]|nr:hypothetical protein [Gemmataceae bacterium]
MKGLTPALFGRACRTFLKLAYPGGPTTITPAKLIFLEIPGDQSLEPLLVPPICECLRTSGGGSRGYAFRLGSSIYPHLKLQVISHDEGATCLFAVDTHDSLKLDPDHPDAAGWRKLQIANRGLKEQIERAWEIDGLPTFNGLLRRELDKT